MSKNKKTLIKLIIIFIMLVSIILVTNFIKMDKHIVLGLYLVCYLFLSYKIVIKAFKRILRGKVLDENFLMVIASISAFIIGEYPEAIAVMLFYQIGELFESYAVKKSRKNISELMDIRPAIATVIKDDKEEVMDPLLVEIGDILIVKVGEKIPVDGIVIKGHTFLDTAALTGESLPQEVEENCNVISGSVNIGSVIYMQVTKLYVDSTVSKILELVENASNKKTKVEKFITRFAKYYTPIVVGLALLISVVPPIFLGEWNIWVRKGITFLVTSCPCALVISVPLSFFGGIGAASRRGILVKGTTYLELIDKANIFVFDKTGTITKGNFEVESIYYTSTKDEILKASYIAESRSNHPLAQSITKYCESNGIKENNIYEIEELAGYGIIATSSENRILAGNYKLLDKFLIDYIEPNVIGSIIHIVKNNVYLGYFVIKDQVKEDSKIAIDYLNKQGYKTIMLTGDKEEVAKEVCNLVNICEYKAELLPSDKVKQLDKLIENKQESDCIAYIGDGINDAPVLMASDIGISMGSIGSDSAIEASDMVLMHDKLTGIIEAKKISKKTSTIVMQNIIFAIGIKITVLFLSLIGITNIWLAVFADVGVSFIAILNAMRTMKIKF